jgi:hypothetical protein
MVLELLQTKLAGQEHIQVAFLHVFCNVALELVGQRSTVEENFQSFN